MICSASSRVGARISARVLPRGRSDQRLHDRQTEGGRFAAAGLGARENVAAFEGRRDRELLNGGGLGEPEVVHGAQQLRLQAELFKIWNL